FLSEQIAATSRETDALSSRFEFMTSGGWQDGHFIVMLRHISDGRIIGGGKNLGETMLLAGIRW
ncbi:MAG: lipid A 3-O-deacylase, partial [Rhodanobacteraceae bacterium]